jgi:hypothetical protein
VTFGATDLYRIANGKIVEEWNTLGLFDVLSQPGTAPMTEQGEEEPEGKLQTKPLTTWGLVVASPPGSTPSRTSRRTHRSTSSLPRYILGVGAEKGPSVA